jgi:hypothetical protein
MLIRIFFDLVCHRFWRLLIVSIDHKKAGTGEKASMVVLPFTNLNDIEDLRAIALSKEYSVDKF